MEITLVMQGDFMLHSALGSHKRTVLFTAAALTLLWLGIFASTVSPSVNFIDSGELITALHEPGVAHPPGYPLYTLMGYVVSNVPVGEVAWRVNMISAFWGAATIGTMFLLVVVILNYLNTQASQKASKEPAKGRRAKVAAPAKRLQGKATVKVDATPAPAESERTFFGQALSEWLTLGFAASVASLLGASSTFWSRTAQAKMYTLHYFFVALLFMLALLARWAYERGDDAAMKRWLLILSATLGLSMSNHLMTVLLVPGLLMMLMVGSNLAKRLQTILRRWVYAIPAVAIPVLLYLYLPLRASQDPLMNWGTTDSWGDFWRHITGWQYGAYLTGTELGRLWGFISGQWAWLTPVILVLGIASGLWLARAHLTTSLATLLTAVATVAFAMRYGISEIEPYLVPLYIMLLVWLGTAPATIQYLFEARPNSALAASRPVTVARSVLVALLALVAITSAITQYPAQNHSNDRLAGQFVENVLSELPPDSVLITDYWDFYAPTIYLQNIQRWRPDVAIVDMSLVKYPWYLGYLQRYSPKLIEVAKSGQGGDVLTPYLYWQRDWLERPGNRLNETESTRLTNLYVGLIDSFIERNFPTRPAYALFQQCDSPQCDSQRVAQNFEKQRVGLTTKLVRKPATATPEPPKEPAYKLEGILVGNQVPMDDFARLNSCLYAQAYAAVAEQFSAANKPEQAEKMAGRWANIREAIPGQCR